MKISLITLVFLVFSSSVVPGPVLTETDRLIIESTFNNEFEIADSLIRASLADYPEDLKYHFFMLNNMSIESIHTVSLAKKSDRNAVRDSVNNEIIKYGESVIEKFEDREHTLNEKFYMGCVHGYLGRLYGLSGSWMSAFGSGQTGKDLLEEVIEEDPTFYDAYLLLGMFYYYGDRMGGIIGFVASILGFSGDRDLGLDYLEIAEEKGTFTKPQAQLILAELYSRMESNKLKGLNYFEEFLNKYPNNPVFLNWYCRDLISLDMIDKLGETIEKDKYGLIDPYVKGHYLSRIRNYDASTEQLEEVMRNGEYYWSGMYEESNLQIVINSWIIGDSSKVERYYPELRGSRKNLADILMKDRSLTERVLDFRYQVCVARQDREIKSFISNPPVFGNNRFFEAFFEFYKGIYYFQNSEFNLAEKAFRSAGSLDEEEFKYASLSYLIDIYERSDVGREKVVQLIDEIEDRDYERLTYRLKDLEKKYRL